MWRSQRSHGLTVAVRMRLCYVWIQTVGSHHTGQDKTSPWLLEMIVLGLSPSRNAFLEVRASLIIIIIRLSITLNNSLFSAEYTR